MMGRLRLLDGAGHGGKWSKAAWMVDLMTSVLSPSFSLYLSPHSCLPAAGTGKFIFISVNRILISFTMFTNHGTL